MGKKKERDGGSENNRKEVKFEKKRTYWNQGSSSTKTAQKRIKQEIR